MVARCSVIYDAFSMGHGVIPRYKYRAITTTVGVIIFMCQGWESIGASQTAAAAVWPIWFAVSIRCMNAWPHATAPTSNGHVHRYIITKYIMCYAFAKDPMENNGGNTRLEFADLIFEWQMNLIPLFGNSMVSFIKQYIIFKPFKYCKLFGIEVNNTYVTLL